MDIETVEWLLREMAKHEHSMLSDTAIDLILAQAPRIQVSEGLRERALAAMQEAQRKRERYEPPTQQIGFLAARGIFADTWDGEPAEVTIRRLRDAD